MKKILISIGIVFIILLIILSIFIGYIIINGQRLDKESLNYANKAISDIVLTWNEQELLNRASPEFLKVTNKANLDSLFNEFRKLGNFSKITKIDGESKKAITFGKKTTITALYKAEVIFDSGPAQIIISLIKHDNKWQIFGFRINSKSLLNK